MKILNYPKMRAGFSHLPVKHDLNKFNMMIFYKCRKIFLFGSCCCCYTLLLTLYFIKIPIKGFSSPLPSPHLTSGAQTVSERRVAGLKTVLTANSKCGYLLNLQGPHSSTTNWYYNSLEHNCIFAYCPHQPLISKHTIHL